MTTQNLPQTDNEAIAFVFANVAKAATDPTRLTQTALKRHGSRKVRRANLMMKRWATVQGLTLDQVRDSLTPREHTEESLTAAAEEALAREFGVAA